MVKVIWPPTRAKDGNGDIVINCEKWKTDEHMITEEHENRGHSNAAEARAQKQSFLTQRTTTWEVLLRVACWTDG